MSDKTSWDSVYKLLHKFCQDYFKKAKYLGMNLDYDDLFQEASIGYVIAKDSFDPNMGYVFNTYLGKIVCNRLAKIIDKEIKIRKNFKNFEITNDNQTQEELFDGLTSQTQPSIEDELIISENEKIISSKLSPLVRLVFELLNNPPIELLQEFDAFKAKCEYANLIGGSFRGYSSMDYRFVVKHIISLNRNLTRTEITNLNEELSRTVLKCLNM